MAFSSRLNSHSHGVHSLTLDANTHLSGILDSSLDLRPIALDADPLSLKY